MNHSRLATLGILVLSLMLPPLSRAVTLSPSPNTAITSSEGLLAPLDGTVTATISKGKAKSVLLIQTTIQYFGSEASSVCVTNFRANNKQLVHPTQFTGSVTCTSCPSGGCTLTSNQWVDLDYAETLFPGEFKGQPVTITADYDSGAGSGATTTMMAVSLQKK